MRVLFLTNMYLEEGWGGEDVSCRQVVEGLRERGHATMVLTSTHGARNSSSEGNGVQRSLSLEMDLVPWRNGLTFFTERSAREAHNRRCLEEACDRFAPDIIFIWGMWNLPRSLPAAAEARYPDRVVYRFASYWPMLPSQYELYWRAPGRTWFSRPAKRVLGHLALGMLSREQRRLPLAYRHAVCVSAAARDRLVEAGIPLAHARIIHTGLDARRYSSLQPQPPKLRASSNLRMLFAGRLVPEKGPETAIGAMERLVRSRGLRSVHLSLAGSGPPEYEDHLHRLVARAQLDDFVSFLGHVPADRMPQLLQEFDVVVLPSTWPEPFSRTVLEGMASGLVVLATPTGGTPEILEHGENGLLFAPGDGDGLADQVSRLMEDPELRQKLANAARRTVAERFTSTRMLDETERLLQEISFPPAHEHAGPRDGPEQASARSPFPTLSVIIPTYNRRGFLVNTLQSLARQTYPSDRFEVIVVDDGSTDGTETITSEPVPFTLRYCRQANQGDAVARNLGAQQSQAEVLVFLDDDMLLDPAYLAGLVQAQDGCRWIVAGDWNYWLPESTPLLEALRASQASGRQEDSNEMSFTEVHSNNMALPREAFFEIGMMHSLAFSGSSIWCDLDFSYRAFQRGFEFRRSRQAVCRHQDQHVRTLSGYSQRWRTAAYRAAALFHVHPGLIAHMPMFHDKTPVLWGEDPPRLIARKLARSVASTPAALWSMEQMARALEKRRPASGILSTLYRFIIGGYIFRGYREGLSAFGHVKN